LNDKELLAYYKQRKKELLKDLEIVEEAIKIKERQVQEGEN